LDDVAFLAPHRGALPALVTWCAVVALSAPRLPAEDCNQNGVEDQLDIAQGSSQDCTRDGVPDECGEERDLFFVTRERHEVCESATDLTQGIVSTDLDGDSDEDVVVACGSGLLTLLSNRGDGRFEPAEHLELEIPPFELLSDDFDGDGDPDLLAVSNRNAVDSQNRMDLYRNDGRGGFALAGSHDTDGRPYRGASGDLDGDGLPEVVLSGTEGDEDQPRNAYLSLARNHGGGFGAMQRLSAGLTAIYPHIADLDGNGRADIATVLWAGGVISVLRNQGDLAFEGPALYDVGLPGGPGPGPSSVDSGDLDGDGDLDLAVGNLDAEVLTLLFNDGAGRFENRELVSASGARSPGYARVADLDRDGDLDVVANGPPLLVYYNLGNRRFTEPVRFGSGGSRWQPALADFDRDGWVDVALGASEGFGWTPTVTVLRNRGGAFAATRTYPVNVGRSSRYDPASIYSGDLDSDGDQDLAVLNHNSLSGKNAIALLRNDGRGEFRDLEHVLLEADDGLSTRLVSIGLWDAEGDGDLDILAAVTEHNPGFALLTNEGGTFREGERIPGPGHGLVPADFDGDGEADFAFGGAIYWNQGGFRLTEEELVQPCGGHQAVADFDADGRPDVAFLCGLRSARGHELWVYRNLGSRRFELIERREWDRFVLALVTGDLDADGDLDLAVGLEAKGVQPGGRFEWISEWGAVEVLRNDGTGRFELAAHEPYEQYAAWLFARDLDGDGDGDLAVGGGGWPTRAEVKLLLSGGGGFEERRTYALDGGTYGVVAGDLDGDGRQDLAVTTQWGINQVSVLINEAPRKGLDSGARGCGDTFFRRGELNDDGAPNFVDAVLLLHYLFAGESEPRCLKAADVDDDGRLAVTDAILLLRYFYGTERSLPAAPFPECGPDPTEDALSCKEAVSCR
jgi:hypothetical protein